MGLDARKAKVGANVSCRLDLAVTLERTESGSHLVAWEHETQCCGSKGIYPIWAREPSTCKGPQTCVLLQNSELFYPPDRRVWLPLVDSEHWEELKSQFMSPDECGCTVPDELREHIEELQRKWGIGANG